MEKISGLPVKIENRSVKKEEINQKERNIFPEEQIFSRVLELMNGLKLPDETRKLYLSQKVKKRHWGLTNEQIDDGLNAIISIIDSMLQIVQSGAITSGNLREARANIRQLENPGRSPQNDLNFLAYQKSIINEAETLRTLVNWLEYIKEEKMQSKDVNIEFLGELAEGINQLLYQIHQYGDPYRFVDNPSKINDLANNISEVQALINFKAKHEKKILEN